MLFTVFDATNEFSIYTARYRKFYLRCGSSGATNMFARLRSSNNREKVNSHNLLSINLAREAVSPSFLVCSLPFFFHPTIRANKIPRSRHA